MVSSKTAGLTKVLGVSLHLIKDLTNQFNVEDKVVVVVIIIIITIMLLLLLFYYYY